MDKRAPSARGEPIPSILKKPKGWRKGDLLDKSTKIKREKVEGSKNKNVSAPLPQGCTPLMYACQQADYKAIVEILNKDVSFRRTSRIMCFECLVIVIDYKKHFVINMECIISITPNSQFYRGFCYAFRSIIMHGT